MDALSSLSGPIFGVLVAHAALGGIAAPGGAFALASTQGRSGAPTRGGGVHLGHAGIARLRGPGDRRTSKPLPCSADSLRRLPGGPRISRRASRRSDRAEGTRERRAAGRAAAPGCARLLGSFGMIEGASPTGMAGALLGLGALGAWLTIRDLRAPPPDRPPASVLAHAVSMTGAYARGRDRVHRMSALPARACMPGAVVWLDAGRGGHLTRVLVGGNDHAPGRSQWRSPMDRADCNPLDRRPEVPRQKAAHPDPTAPSRRSTPGSRAFHVGELRPMVRFRRSPMGASAP